MREEERLNADSSDGNSYSLLAANRTFADVIEAEQRAIDLESSKQYIGYLKSFIPDNFMKAGCDNDSILLCLLFPRFSAKALLLVKLLNMKYPFAQGGLRREHITLSHKAEQWAHMKNFNYSLHMLNTITQKFISYVFLL